MAIGSRQLNLPGLVRSVERHSHLPLVSVHLHSRRVSVGARPQFAENPFQIVGCQCAPVHSIYLNDLGGGDSRVRIRFAVLACLHGGGGLCPVGLEWLDREIHHHLRPGRVLHIACACISLENAGRSVIQKPVAHRIHAWPAFWTILPTKGKESLPPGYPVEYLLNYFRHPGI